MPASRSAKTEPSYTSLAEQALIKADDFLSVEQIIEVTGLTWAAVRSSLGWLRKCKAIDSVESGGQLYWFSTLENDQRSKKIEERKREDEPRKPKTGKKKSQ